MVSVSIIIPVYKVEKYVEECIRSVMSQTYEGDMECIIVDDCGDDESIAICERLITEYTGPIKFKILHHTHNRGLSAARNTGIDAAKGDYLYFIDSDDYISTIAIASFAKIANKYQDVDLIQGSNIEGQGAIFNYIYDMSQRKYAEYSNDKKWVNYQFFNSLPWNVWNRFIRKDLVIKNHLYFAEGLIYEDLQWILVAHTYINNIAFCKEPTYYYRLRKDSITGTDTPEKNLLTRFKILKYSLKLPKFKDTRNSTLFIFHSCLYLFGYNYIGKEYDNILENHLTERNQIIKSMINIRTLPWRLRTLAYIFQNKITTKKHIWDKIANLLYLPEYFYSLIKPY